MIELFFSSGVTVSAATPWLFPDWSGSASLPPLIKSDVAWDLALVLDLDAPYPAAWGEPILSPLLHGAAASDGRQLLEWLPMRPPRDSRPHRYLVLLFRSPAWAQLSPARLPDWAVQRARFDVKRLALEWRLERVDELVYYSGYGMQRGVPPKAPK
jgi:hypothetical protein